MTTDDAVTRLGFSPFRCKGMRELLGIPLPPPVPGAGGTEAAAAAGRALLSANPRTTGGAAAGRAPPRG